MPCAEIFDAQDAAYKESVFRGVRARIAIEAAADYWRKYVGLTARWSVWSVLALPAPAKIVFERLLTVAHVLKW